MSFLWDWFSGIMSYFGLFSKDAKILFLGLDNAGKTTLLGMLKHDKISTHQPTHHPGTSELTVGNVHIKAFDLGGHEAARKLWTTYFEQVDAVVYLIDCADVERFPEAKKELDVLLSTEKLATTPFLILGNKIDMPSAVPEMELRRQLGITATTGKETKSVPKDVRPVELFMCSILRKTGYKEGFDWLTNFL